ncbi:hypothetical protein HOY80DRAFT_370944 [Tuber brumale]|nr:hypothetical protein HOY80DRAFT_370944 [Tuber brumale]
MSTPSSYQSSASYDPNLPPAPPPKPISSAAGSRTTSPMPVGALSAPPPPPPPPTDDGFVPSVLLNKSRDDLEHILNSPQLLEALFATTHPTASSADVALIANLQHNAELAARLAALESKLATARESAERALVETRQLERTWRDREKEMYQALQPFSSPALYSRLVNAVGDAEAVADAMAESFLEEGGRDVGEFVREYRALRKTYHLRKERKERWDEGRVGGWR